MQHEAAAATQPFFVLKWKFAPGAVLPRPFTLRQTQDQRLVGGRISTLTRSRDYIHTLEAGPDGAEGIDIGILHTRDVGFSYLALEATSDSQRIRARWDRGLTRAVRGI
ncbi:MAG: hypothetical protein P8Y95_16775 [Gammaproteobacteria bacterium]